MRRSGWRASSAGFVLVNTSRGGLIDIDALDAALEIGPRRGRRPRRPRGRAGAGPLATDLPAPERAPDAAPRVVLDRGAARPCAAGGRERVSATSRASGRGTSSTRTQQASAGTGLRRGSADPSTVVAVGGLRGGSRHDPPADCSRMDRRDLVTAHAGAEDCCAVGRGGRPDGRPARISRVRSHRSTSSGGDTVSRRLRRRRPRVRVSASGVRVEHVPVDADVASVSAPT